MRISHKYGFVFLALPRTGTTTTRKVLDDYSDIKSIHISEISKTFPFYNHISAVELKDIFDERGWDWFSYKRFCVVRNPYDRVVSLYHHRQKLKVERIELAGIVWKFLYKMNDILRPTNTFREYVFRINPKRPLRISLKPFISDKKGNLLVDDVLMFENLTDELPKYLETFDISIKPEDIPHLNATQNRRAYRDYYDEATKQRVSELYSYEINRFGYRF